jgi:hypothetical protein
MKRSTLLINFYLCIILFGLSFTYYNPIFAGIGAYLFITTIFEYKKYHNIKLYLVLIGAILIISLISTFIQLSSPSSPGNTLLIYLSAILFIGLVILTMYDYNHDYKVSKILQMKNVSPLSKDIITIVLLIIGLIVGWLIGVYYYKI